LRAARALGAGISAENCAGPITEATMGLLKWALICLLISLVAGAFGYTGLARGAAQISKILFFLFLVLFIVILILAITAGEIIF
jgi:uncharacterized membrane protein YtjA (UPF0391 family)